MLNCQDGEDLSLDSNEFRVRTALGNKYMYSIYYICTRVRPFFMRGWKSSSNGTRFDTKTNYCCRNARPRHVPKNCSGVSKTIIFQTDQIPLVQIAYNCIVQVA